MKRILRITTGCLLGILVSGVITNCLAEENGKKKIVLIAGRPSHGPGDHEFNAGVQLLHKCLQNQPGVTSTFHLNGWPKDRHAFDNADTILFFMDGGRGHPIIQDDHLEIIGDLMKKGVGLACVHYAVEVPKDKGGPEFLDWIGGYYEDRFSTNPHWVADIKSLPNHPITRGVKPFAVKDEWYYNMRFRPEMKGVTAILVAKPDDETRQGKSSSPRGPYPHIVADSGREEVLAWAVERSDGGRGFGFTGAHNHINWGNDSFRKLVLNALLWTAKAEVPTGGVQSVVTAEGLKQNLDPKGQKVSPLTISGLWTFNVDTALGSGTPTFTFKQDGENLTGTYQGALGEEPVTGTLKGSDVKFSFKGRLQDEEIIVTYTGKVEGKDSMKGTVKLGELGEGTWTAKK
jgi:type 1 glutamine amidotransferase